MKTGKRRWLLLLPLAALLAEQEADLARQRADLDWAGQVCRAMRETGVNLDHRFRETSEGGLAKLYNRRKKL